MMTPKCFATQFMTADNNTDQRFTQRGLTENHFKNYKPSQKYVNNREKNEHEDTMQAYYWYTC